MFDQYRLSDYPQVLLRRDKESKAMLKMPELHALHEIDDQNNCGITYIKWHIFI